MYFYYYKLNIPTYDLGRENYSNILKWSACSCIIFIEKCCNNAATRTSVSVQSRDIQTEVTDKIFEDTKSVFPGH
jgi:hypothetical protein